MNESRIRQVFRISVLLKGAHAVIECLGGIALALVSTHTMVALVGRLTQDELIEAPRDFVANSLMKATAALSGGERNFYSFYLLSHGIVKLALVAGLLANRLWAYPTSLVAMSLFIAYQVYRFSYTRSAGLIVLSLFDVAVMVLIWHEYRLMRRRGAAAA